MKLKYYLVPLEKAAAWQVVDGVELSGHVVNGRNLYYDPPKIERFDSNETRDEWIADVHEYLAEWAYGKDEVPEAVREADDLIATFPKSYNDFDKYIEWREKWMKPREPKHLGNFLYEV